VGRWDLRRCRGDGCPVAKSCERFWLRFDKTRYYIESVYPGEKGCHLWVERRGPEKKKEMKLADYKFPFGSHKGKTLEQIYKADPNYLMWARDELNPPVSDKVADYLAEKNREIVDRGKNVDRNY